MVRFLVKLVSITPDAEKLILYCARVSSNQDNDSTGLLKYLINNKHWSPFEMAHAVFEIETNRAIAAQILRHRSFSFQEFSQRYATVGGTQKFKARRQSEKNRQSSTDNLDRDQIDWFDGVQREVEDYTYDFYTYALERGIAKEQARFLLPLATKTKLYMAGTIRSWIHYIELRTDEHTQYEHQVIAIMIRNKLGPQIPHTAEALGW